MNSDMPALDVDRAPQMRPRGAWPVAITRMFAADAQPSARFAATAVCAAFALLGKLAFVLDAEWAGIALVTACYVAGGLRTTREAIAAVRSGLPDINFLMILAALVSAALGHWDEGALLLFLFSLSDALERYAIEHTRRGIRSLMKLRPDSACRVDGGVEQRVAVDALRVGDHVRVRPGERFAADGVVADGSTAADESIVTGESAPVDKRPGDAVLAGSLNEGGSVLVRVTKSAAQSTLARLVQMVEEAQEHKPRAQRLIERWQTPYVLGVLGASALTFLGYWLAGQSAAASVRVAMVLLVAASPCAVVLASPVAVLAAVTRGARLGVLFKGGAHLERLALVRTVALDKTGTITSGRPQLVSIQPAPGHSEQEVLAIAASLEANSEHPLARAVVAAARQRNVELRDVRQFRSETGFGVVGEVDGRRAVAGRALLYDRLEISLPPDLRAMDAGATDGTNIVAWQEGGAAGVLTLADTIRPGASAALAALRGAGVGDILMLTGDRAAAATRVAREVGITHVQSALRPEDKLDIIRDLARRDGGVAMVGDGVNDAPALAAATVGISLGGAGSDVALETADVVLMRDDLGRIADAIRIARRCREVIRQSLAFALATIAVLVGFTLVGWLPLPIAVLGHEGSTVLVVLNGLRILTDRDGTRAVSAAAAPVAGRVRQAEPAGVRAGG